MTFTLTLFVFAFLPAVLLVYHLIPRRFTALSGAALLIASLAFYAWGEPINLLILLVSVTLNYFISRMMSKNTEIKGRRLWLAAALIFNLGLLAVFKTTGILPPIGISFITLKLLSYIFDVYTKKTGVRKNPFKYSLYILFFPGVIAGPLNRYNDFEWQSVDAGAFTDGAARFVRGFAKKILIADTLALTADGIFGSGTEMGAAVAWLGAAAWSFQLFFDLSGYADMAIGLGNMFGFKLPEDFNYPGMSISLRDFWHRWHISLCSWFREYIYLPLGGDTIDKNRTYMNLIIVFIGAGLWHGGSFNIIFLGIYHGLFMVLERALLGKILDRLPRFAGRVYTLMIVLTGWVIFRADTLFGAFSYIGTMFNFSRMDISAAVDLIDRTTLTAFAAAIVLSLPVIPWLKEKLLRRKYGPGISDALTLAGVTGFFILSAVFLTGRGSSPFILFRF
ncbi:MAG: MBOAT family protein [Eubacteriales bacterium]|jgi:alginate O-acetyltransferase complex protein AlgI|nr:MBOAT family protein [Eubacteriales bacterium]